MRGIDNSDMDYYTMSFKLTYFLSRRQTTIIFQKTRGMDNSDMDYYTGNFKLNYILSRK